MNDMRQNSSLWDDLRSSLAGSFTARARGLVAVEFALLRRDGEDFGRLVMRGLEGAQFNSGDLTATIERSGATGNVRYRMLSGGTEILTANGERFAGGGLEITCGDQRYEARASLLRNSAMARSLEGVEVARVAGGFLGRGYEAALDPGDSCALPVAVLLLYHTASGRSRAYLTTKGARYVRRSRKERE